MKRRGRYDRPDLGPRADRFPEPPDADGNVPEPPSTQQIEALARKYGYPVEFDLVRPIQDAWFSRRVRTLMGSEPSMAIHRDFLKKMARRAKALQESLIRVGGVGVERSAILDAIGTDNFDLDDLNRRVGVLFVGATIGAKQLKRTRSGRRGDQETLRLLCKLFELNVEVFGESAPRITKADDYQGRFFDFADDVLQLFGIQKSNAALGKAIEKAIKIVDRTKNRESP